MLLSHRSAAFPYQPTPGAPAGIAICVACRLHKLDFSSESWWEFIRPCVSFDHLNMPLSLACLSSSGKVSSFRQVVCPSLSHELVALPLPFWGCLMSSLSLTSKHFTLKAPCVEKPASVSLLS